MSYPPYNPQEPGMYPPPQHATTPLTYPIYPGSAAPTGFPSYPSNPSMPMPTSSPYPSSYPSQPAPYPTSAHNPTHSSPYPMNPSQSSPYPSNPSQPSPYPSQPSPYPSQSSPYPAQSSPYPSQNMPYPTQQTYPPSQPSAYPPQQQHTSPYPSQPSGYPNQSSSNTNHSYPPYPGSGGNSHPHHPHPGHGHAGHTQPSKGTPTVRPVSPFDPRQDAEILRKAMKGFGTDEKAIISVLTNRTNHQRQEISLQFKTLYGKDLIKDLKNELSGNFEDLIVALMMPIPHLLARDLNNAISGFGTEEETIVEILCTATNSEIHAIRSAYQHMYGKSLEDDMAGDTSGCFRRLLVSLCQGARSENYMVDSMGAQHDAQALLRAGELTLGTDESTFNAILCSRSYPQLNQIFLEYQRLTGHDFTKAIQNEFSGDIQDGLLAIVKSVRDKHSFFAELLHASMKGAGTRDKALQRIVAVRSEIDMVEIKRAFTARYGKSLEEYIHDDTSGDYKKALLSLVSGA